MKRERFVELFSKEIDAGTAAIFAGAGLSVPAGCVNWRELLREIAHELGLDIDRETDLVSVAQYHVNRQAGNRGHLNKAIIEELTPKTPPTRNHRTLSRLPISTWWTTNYDQLIETALREEGRVPDVKFENSQLAHTKPRRDSTVFKMHGDIDHPARAVLTRDDYERYERDHAPFLNALSGDLVSKTFLFIGFGFSDPNLASVLAHIRVRFDDNQRPHYAIFKTVTRDDFQNETDFEHEKIKQILVLEDLKRFNISSVMVESYSEIDDILNDIYRKHISKYVFVSTSAHDFLPWGEQAVQSFISKLGRILTERGFRIVTGLGLGTGNALMSGAAMAIVEQPEKKLDEDILIRPFPRFVDNPTEREALWTNWRKDMISRAGMALFLFGNKLAGSGVILATGMIEEYDIAHAQGVTLLPIGGTGSVSSVLCERSLNNAHGELAGLSDEAQKSLCLLAKHTGELDKLIGPIIDLIDQARQNSLFTSS